MSDYTKWLRTHHVMWRLAGMSLMVAPLGGVGCSPTAPSRPVVTDDSGREPRPAHDHAHPDHEHGLGPHGGTLADWGAGSYHVEFTVDHDAKEAVVYVLGADEKTPAPVQASERKLLLTIREPAFQVELIARPVNGESEEMASRYVGSHENLGIVREFSGTLSGLVDGTPYAGDFEERAHGHEAAKSP